MPSSTGSETIHITEATSADQLNIGMRMRRMPGERSARTVVARQMAPSTRASVTMAVATIQRSTPSARPPPGPPFMRYETVRRTPPTSQAQNEAAAARGKAMARAPSCRGTTTKAMPRVSGATSSSVSATRWNESTWPAVSSLEDAEAGRVEPLEADR